AGLEPGLDVPHCGRRRSSMAWEHGAPSIATTNSVVDEALFRLRVMTLVRVYVSSTYPDLVKYREQVRLAMLQLQLNAVGMESSVAEEERPVATCLDEVRSCDLYIGIVAWRYGYVPAGHERSITELEYRAAGEANMHRLIFLLDENTPWP